jgi:hypothetical protein
MHNLMIPDSNPKIVIHAPLCRTPWGKLYYFCRSLDPSGSGQVLCERGQLLTFFNIDNSTLYRWLRQGRKDGAFRHYSRSKEQFLIYLGSKNVITFNLGLANWGAATAIVRSDLAQPNFLDQVTAQQTYWLQRRSRTAAVRRVRADRIRNPNLAKIDLSRATDKPTLQFFRNKIPHGTSQTGVGKTLQISDRTVRRHLKPVRRVQQVHKIPYNQGWAEIQIAGETGQKPKCFIRNNEAYAYGCNIYDLAFDQRSETTQRLKHLFFLCKLWRRLRVDRNNHGLSIDRIVQLWDESSFCKSLAIEHFVDIRSFEDFKKQRESLIKEQRRRKRMGKDRILV